MLLYGKDNRARVEFGWLESVLACHVGTDLTRLPRYDCTDREHNKPARRYNQRPHHQQRNVLSIRHFFVNSPCAAVQLILPFPHLLPISSIITNRTDATLSSILPLLPPLVVDTESIVRQNLAAQLLPLSVALICDGRPKVSTFGNGLDGCSSASGGASASANGSGRRVSNAVVSPTGYEAVTSTILPYLFQLLTDHDLDTRRCASDSLSNLCARLRSPDVETVIEEAAKLAATPPAEDEEGGGGMSSKALRKKKAKAAAAAAIGANGAVGGVGGGDPPSPEDLKTVSSNLLAEIASLSTPQPSASVTPRMVSSLVFPPLLALISDPHFRVRRAAVQALPRVLAGGTVDDAASYILPALTSLSTDDMYRVRKAVGECLVDMSRAVMLLGDGPGRSQRGRLLELRREQLIPLCTQLLDDANKFVRHAMQQFLGPFLASFYPLGPRDGRSGAEDGNEDDDAAGTVGVMRLLEPNAAGGVVGG